MMTKKLIYTLISFSRFAETNKKKKKQKSKVLKFIAIQFREIEKKQIG